MINNNMSAAVQVRARLIETGGRTAQDRGLERIGYLYLTDGDCSLDQIPVSTICQKMKYRNS